jgi:threonine dehydrogenase-like Zn-dependent dehydrogenase
LDIDKKSRILVLGAGPIGALIHCLLTIKGFDEAYITDISEYRRRAIQQRFPESVVDPSGEYDHVFETTGSSEVLKNIVPKVLRKKGALVLVGLFGAPADFDFTQVVEMEWTIRGCAAFSSELPEAAKVLEKHWPKFEHIVRHLLSFNEGQTAFDILLNPSKEAMKIVFTQ